MSKKTKTVLVLISLVLLFVVANIVQADWECNRTCTGCILHCDEPDIHDDECCASCEHSLLGPVYCCYPKLCRNAER